MKNCNKKSCIALRKQLIFQVSITIIILLITMIPVRGDATSLKKDFTFVGGSSKDEEVLAMEFISDEIVYLAGDIGNNTHPAGFFLMKLNVSKLRAGNPNYEWSFFWQRTDAMSRFGDMIIDSSGNIYIAGTLEANGKDLFLMRFNSEGILEWNITYGTIGLESTQGIPGPFDYSHPFGRCLGLDSANNVYIVGKSETDVVLIKYNNLGIYQWNQTWDIYNQWGVDVEGYCIDFEIDSNGNTYLALALGDYFDEEFLVLKCNNNGIIQWNSTYNLYFSSQWFQAPMRVLLASDGLFFCSEKDLVKFDLDTGDQLWNETIWSGITVKMDYDLQGNLIILGGTDGSTKYNQLISFAPDTTIQANYSWTSYRMPVDFCTDNDGSIFILLDTTYIKKLDPNGDLQYDFDWGHVDDVSSKIYVDSSDNIYVGGITTVSGMTEDYNIFLSTFSKELPDDDNSLEFIIIVSSIIGGAAIIGVAIFVLIRRKRK